MNRYERHLKDTGAVLPPLVPMLDSKRCDLVTQLNEQLGEPTYDGQKITAVDETGREHKLKARPFAYSKSGFGWYFGWY